MVTWQEATSWFSALKSQSTRRSGSRESKRVQALWKVREINRQYVRKTRTVTFHKVVSVLVVPPQRVKELNKEVAC